MEYPPSAVLIGPRDEPLMTVRAAERGSIALTSPKTDTGESAMTKKRSATSIAYCEREAIDVFRGLKA